MLLVIDSPKEASRDHGSFNPLAREVLFAGGSAGHNAYLPFRDVIIRLEITPVLIGLASLIAEKVAGFAKLAHEKAGSGS